MLNEFKDFIAKGNVMDMAVGIIIGAAFTAIVSSLVGDLINPIIGLIIGGHRFLEHVCRPQRRCCRQALVCRQPANAVLRSLPMARSSWRSSTS